MQTDALIADLAGKVRAAPPHTAVTRLCLAVVISGAVAFGLLLWGLGLRPDVVEASRTAPFWMKWAFTLPLVYTSLVLVSRMGELDGRIGLAWLGIAAPTVLVAMMAVADLVSAPQDDRIPLIVGHTAARCTTAILVLAVPAYLLVLRAFRHLAQTRLRAAAVAAGLLAGAAGASLYAFTCPETSPAFRLA
jgi:hypothetical protein